MENRNEATQAEAMKHTLHKIEEVHELHSCGELSDDMLDGVTGGTSGGDEAKSYIIYFAKCNLCSWQSRASDDFAARKDLDAWEAHHKEVSPQCSGDMRRPGDFKFFELDTTNLTNGV